MFENEFENVFWFGFACRGLGQETFKHILELHPFDGQSIVLKALKLKVTVVFSMGSTPFQWGSTSRHIDATP